MPDISEVSTPQKVSVPVVDGKSVELVVHASKHNTGKRPAIVLVHGNSLSSKMFIDQLGDASLTSFYDVYATDLPGHGDSANATPETESIYSIDGFPKAIAGAMKGLGLEGGSTIVFGHSLGGHIAIRMLPLVNLAGVGCVGTPPFDLPIDFEPRFVMTDPNMGILFKPEPYTREEAETRTRGQLAPGYSPLPEWMVQDCLRRDPAFARVLSASVGGTTVSEIALLRDSRVPFLLMHGAEERLIHQSFLEGLAKELPSVFGGRVEVIAGSGHTPSFEKPEAFSLVLLEFAHSVFKK